MYLITRDAVRRLPRGQRREVQGLILKGFGSSTLPLRMRKERVNGTNVAPPRPKSYAAIALTHSAGITAIVIVESGLPSASLTTVPSGIVNVAPSRDNVVVDVTLSVAGSMVMFGNVMGALPPPPPRDGAENEWSGQVAERET